MISPKTARRTIRRGGQPARRLALPTRSPASRRVPARAIAVRGYTVPLERIGLTLLAMVIVGSIHLSVCSLAAFKEGEKQALRSGILRLQRTSREREEAVELAARKALGLYQMKGMVRLPVETITVPRAGKGGGQDRRMVTTGGGTSARGEGKDRRNVSWYWKIEEGMEKAMSRKGEGRG